MDFPFLVIIHEFNDKMEELEDPNWEPKTISPIIIGYESCKVAYHNTGSDCFIVFDTFLFGRNGRTIHDSRKYISTDDIDVLPNPDQL